MKKLIVLIIGPSGAGKTTLLEKTFKPEQILRSTTTRSLRPGEIPNQDYLFTTKPQFEKLIATDALIQFVKYDHQYYGVTKAEVRTKLTQNQVTAIPIIYPALKDFTTFAKQEPNARTLAVFTDISKDTLRKHFANRTESPVQKATRIAKYEEEIANKPFFPKEHVLDMNPDDHAFSASQYLKNLIKEAIEKS